MAKKQDKQPWNATDIEAISPTTPEAAKADADTMTKYVELVREQSLTDGQVRELGQLAHMLGKTAADVELDHLVLAEAERLTQIAGQREVVLAAREETRLRELAARQRISDDIAKMQWALTHATYPEHTEAVAVERRWEEVQGADNEIGALKTRFPELFGTAQKPEKVYGGGYPNVIADAAARLNISL
jgi:hypothetical protein